MLTAVAAKIFRNRVPLAAPPVEATAAQPCQMRIDALFRATIGEPWGKQP
jgi:hypothetical protein